MGHMHTLRAQYAAQAALETALFLGPLLYTRTRLHWPLLQRLALCMEAAVLLMKTHSYIVTNRHLHMEKMQGGPAVGTLVVPAPPVGGSDEGADASVPSSPFVFTPHAPVHPLAAELQPQLPAQSAQPAETAASAPSADEGLWGKALAAVHWFDSSLRHDAWGDVTTTLRGWVPEPVAARLLAASATPTAAASAPAATETSGSALVPPHARQLPGLRAVAAAHAARQGSPLAPSDAASMGLRHRGAGGTQQPAEQPQALAGIRAPGGSDDDDDKASSDAKASTPVSAAKQAGVSAPAAAQTTAEEGGPITNTQGTPCVQAYVSYPHNVTVGDFVLFTLAPTLVYEPNYPRTTTIRAGYLFEKLFLIAGLVYAGYTLLSQYYM